MSIAVPVLVVFVFFLGVDSGSVRGDHIHDLQSSAIEKNKAEFGHWGDDPENYKQWGTHSNRLIPVYTFGSRLNGQSSEKLHSFDLDNFSGENSPYRKESELKRIYGRLPSQTLNSTAVFMDQTNIYDIQKAAFENGKKYVFLVIFDGMDWDTTRAAAIYKTGMVAYTSGRGTGLHMQDYTAAGTTQFGFMCTAPHNAGTKADANTQTVTNPGGTSFGGYNIERGGPNPWTPGNDRAYLMGKSKEAEYVQPYTDSSCSASSMTAGIKSYNGAVNVDPTGERVRTIAHWAQDLGFSVGAVSSV
ncbi:MAG: alkaline phosphatase, partial [Planctomycetes bacterium]|nr:alkaline phosphatase [Planctomycetota bacterium]